MDSPPGFNHSQSPPKNKVVSCFTSSLSDEDQSAQILSLRLELKIKNDSLRNLELINIDLTQQNNHLIARTKEFQQLSYYHERQISTYKNSHETYKLSIIMMERSLRLLCEDVTKKENKKKIFEGLNQIKSELIQLKEALLVAEEANYLTSTPPDLRTTDRGSDMKSSIGQRPLALNESNKKQPSSLTVIPKFSSTSSLPSSQNLGVVPITVAGVQSSSSNSRKYIEVNQMSSMDRFEFEVTNLGSHAVIPASQLQIESADTLEERKENSNHPSPGAMELAETKSDDVKMRKALSEGDPDFEKHFSLLKWLSFSQLESKISPSDFSKIKMVYYNNYRGVHAKQKIKKGEQIVFIPLSHMMTLDSARVQPICNSIIQKKVQLQSPKHSLLSVYLLQEKKNSNSYWKPFLDVLPEEYTTYPILYTKEELSWLEGSVFLQQIAERQELISSDYQQIIARVPEFKKLCSLDEFAWARVMTSSRIYGLSINNKRTDAFVPLADMFNHRRPSQTSWGYCEERGGFRIYASEDIRSGDQIYYSCGRKCNSRFLLNYGFVVKSNEANEVSIKVSLYRMDKYLKYKLAMLKDNQDSRTFRLAMNYENKSVMELLGFLRFALINDKEVLQTFYEIAEGEGNEFNPNQTPPFSLENEKQLWSEIHRISEAMLSQYPTTLEEDKIILETKQLSINQKNCVILRMGEKEIISHYVVMAERMSKLLTMTKKEVKKHILQNKDFTKYSSYVNGVVLSLLQSAKHDPNYNNQID